MFWKQIWDLRWSICPSLKKARSTKHLPFEKMDPFKESFKLGSEASVTFEICGPTRTKSFPFLPGLLKFLHHRWDLKISSPLEPLLYQVNRPITLFGQAQHLWLQEERSESAIRSNVNIRYQLLHLACYRTTSWNKLGVAKKKKKKQSVYRHQLVCFILEENIHHSQRPPLIYST